MSVYSEPVAVLPLFNPADFSTVLTTTATNVETAWQNELTDKTISVINDTTYIEKLFDPLQNTVNGGIKSSVSQFTSNTQVNWIIQSPTGGALICDAGVYIVTVCASVNFNQPSGVDYTYATEPSWFGIIYDVDTPQYNYLLYNDITSWGMALIGTFIIQKNVAGNIVVSVGFNTKNPFSMIVGQEGVLQYPPSFSVIKLK
jgi:hypothetical protein